MFGVPTFKCWTPISTMVLPSLLIMCGIPHLQTSRTFAHSGTTFITKSHV